MCLWLKVHLADFALVGKEFCPPLQVKTYDCHISNSLESDISVLFFSFQALTFLKDEGHSRVTWVTWKRVITTEVKA